MSTNFVPTTTELALVNQIFAQADTQKIGILTGDVAVKIFQGAKLPPNVLGEIWSIADDDNSGFLTKKGVTIAVRLMGHAQKGHKVDRSLVNKREMYCSFTTTPYQYWVISRTISYSRRRSGAFNLPRHWSNNTKVTTSRFASLDASSQGQICQAIPDLWASKWPHQWYVCSVAYNRG